MPIAKCIFCLNGILNSVQVVCICYLREKYWFLKRMDFIGGFFSGCTTKKVVVFLKMLEFIGQIIGRVLNGCMANNKGCRNP